MQRNDEGNSLSISIEPVSPPSGEPRYLDLDPDEGEGRREGPSPGASSKT